MMRYPTIPKSVAFIRNGKSIVYTWQTFCDEFVWMDRRWSKDPNFRATYNATAERMNAAEEGSIFPMESRDFENFAEVIQEFPPQGVQVFPDIVRPIRKMINEFLEAPTEDPRAKSGA
jgi:hypothetical protein